MHVTRVVTKATSRKMEAEIIKCTRMAVQNYFYDPAVCAQAVDKLTRLKAAQRLITSFETRLRLELFDDVD